MVRAHLNTQLIVFVFNKKKGCGKTTQVPQYILEDYTLQKKYCNIIVTQPRRIAAISVAKRVCFERGWRLGGLCGYQIGRDREHVSEDTRITYCTTGVLLEKLIGPQAQENFSKYTHIILDEVHERDLETDFVLLIIKIQSLRNLSASSKVILMSATIDCDMFRKYFAQEKHEVLEASVSAKTSKVSRKAPVFLIENMPFNVQEFYWDDLVAPNSFMTPYIYKSYNVSCYLYRDMITMIS
jgi:ATP-dependent RNA helicase TDRD9